MLRPDPHGALPASASFRLLCHELFTVTLWASTCHSVFFSTTTPLLHTHVPRLQQQPAHHVFVLALVPLLGIWDIFNLWMESPINPAITLCLLLTGKLPFRSAFIISLGQFIGNFLAVVLARFLAFFILPDYAHSTFQPPVPHDDLSFVTAVLFEMMATASFCIVTLSMDDIVAPQRKFQRWLVSTTTMVALILGGAGWTGSIMNPALCLALAIMHGNWRAQEVYWLGPMAGAVLAAVFLNWRQHLKTTRSMANAHDKKDDSKKKKKKKKKKEKVASNGKNDKDEGKDKDKASKQKEEVAVDADKTKTE